MANPTAMQKKNGKYLWFSLLGLGFQPNNAKFSMAAGRNNVNTKHIHLGPNMFDKPNKDAFYIVTHFLLDKLNPARFSEAYRYCWPVLDHKADAEFRKVTCAWLREIMDEISKSGSKVVASLFLSPGGPKFVHLMLNLANHVMLQELKTFTTDDSWVPDAAAMPASSLDMAVKRLNLISDRFLKTAVDQDRFLHDYQRKAQLLMKSMRDIRSEGAKYDDLLKRYSSTSPQDGGSTVEKIRQVRSSWSAIDEMLSRTTEERQAVGSVLMGDVDQYILDGTDRVLQIPRCLLERVEQLPHQLTSGNVYEGGQLNILCVLELTNHALHLLREERRRVAYTRPPQLSPRLLQEKRQQMSRALQSVHFIRQKISKEGIPEVRSAIRGLEAEWDRKWSDTLKHTPLVSFLKEEPALGFLSPMAPLSFEPAAEASCSGSIFSQFPATLLEEKPAQMKSQDVVMSSIPSAASDLESPSHPAAADGTEAPAEAPSQANTSFDWLFDTPPSAHVRAPSAPTPPLKTSGRKTSRAQTKASPIRTRTQILDMECENLADQFAEAVTTSGLSDASGAGLDLERLLTTLHGDPFSTRKQLPRTPESLILDVKSSWRKALEDDRTEKVGRAVGMNDSLIGRLTPLYESNPAAPSSSVSWSPHPFMSHSDSPVGRRGGVVRPASLWDSIGAVELQSLDQETLPEVPSCDSLLSLEDEEEDELLVPSLKLEATPSPRHAGRSPPACNNGSFMDIRKGTPERLPSDLRAPGLAWPPAATDADKVFSLDLDALETPSPTKTQEYSLPQLITFSPIDDMKC
ncbi:HAUS augmin-like complex subunit 6 [Antennarius striatus]|uniref:HAUS augmin-like complex subunit 6 n=1 Tax=Antennarius striatus TaxID=241820 RepID=UPI0035B4A3C4